MRTPTDPVPGSASNQWSATVSGRRTRPRHRPVPSPVRCLPHTKNPIPEHRQSLFCNRSRPARAAGPLLQWCCARFMMTASPPKRLRCPASLMCHHEVVLQERQTARWSRRPVGASVTTVGSPMPRGDRAAARAYFGGERDTRRLCSVQARYPAPQFRRSTADAPGARAQGVRPDAKGSLPAQSTREGGVRSGR